jgi:hypothetical protein
MSAISVAFGGIVLQSRSNRRNAAQFLILSCSVTTRSAKVRSRRQIFGRLSRRHLARRSHAGFCDDRRVRHPFSPDPELGCLAEEGPQGAWGARVLSRSGLARRTDRAVQTGQEPGRACGQTRGGRRLGSHTPGSSRVLLPKSGPTPAVPAGSNGPARSKRRRAGSRRQPRPHPGHLRRVPPAAARRRHAAPR